VIQQTFKDIEDLKETDKDVYKAFWVAVGAGLRRGEIRRLDWSHIIDRGGRLWVSGGIGKDGEVIEVRIQKRASEKLAPFRKTSGPFVAGGDKPARRLNEWLGKNHWKTEKKIHELRAYIGSLLYQVNPTAAKKFMRHKSIRVTETFYCHYGVAAQPVDVL
jgi:integrase